MRGLAAVVLAAGRGDRLRPLTDKTPKPLLTVGDQTLLDAALDRVGSVVPLDPDHVAINANWLADQIVAAVDGRAHVSIERPEALGTAGAIGNLRDWLKGRDVLVTNADAWFEPPPDLSEFADGDRPRLLVVRDEERPDFDGQWRFAGVSLLPGPIAERLTPVPSGLYEAVWRDTELDLVPTDVEYVDCGTPADLARARAHARTRAGGPG